MYHSIYFGNNDTWRNTWTTWFLVPKERPSFAPPQRRTRYLDIPGSSKGSLDLSNYPQGYPLYENRQGSWTFIVVNPTYEQGEQNNIPWYEVQSRIQRFFNGKTLKAVLEDDPYWYYEGSFDITGFSSGEKYSEVTISYNVTPYKFYYLSANGVKYDPTGTLPGKSDFETRDYTVYIEHHMQANIYLEYDEEWEEMDVDERNQSDSKYMPLEDYVGDCPLFPEIRIDSAPGNKFIMDMTYKESGKKFVQRKEMIPGNTDYKSKVFMITNKVDLSSSWFFFDNDTKNYPDYAFNIEFDFRKGAL